METVEEGFAAYRESENYSEDPETVFHAGALCGLAILDVASKKEISDEEFGVLVDRLVEACSEKVTGRSDLVH